MVQTETGRQVFNSLSENGRIVIDGALLEDGQFVFGGGQAIISSDIGTGADAFLSLSSARPSDSILDSMDAITGWEVDSAMTNITVNAITKKEGSGALNLIKASTSSSYAGIWKTINSVDLTSKYVKIWLFLRDVTTRNKIARAKVNLVDNEQSSSEWHFSGTSLDVGWNLLLVDTETVPNYTENPDLTDITEIQIYVNTNQGTDTYAEGDVIADWYRYAGFDILDVGVGADAILAKSAAVLDLDAGAGADAILESVSSRIESDTGVGADLLVSILKAIAKYSSDAGTGVGAISALLATLARSDQGAGVDILGSRLLGSSDAGIGLGVVSELLAALEESDEGAGADAWGALLASIKGSDIGAGTEAGISVSWLRVLLKLLQAKGISMGLSHEKLLSMKLSQKQQERKRM